MILWKTTDAVKAALGLKTCSGYQLNTVILGTGNTSGRKYFWLKGPHV